MDRVLFTLSVPKCVGCKSRLDYGQKAFCPKCSAIFSDFRTRNCSHCNQLLHRCSCSNSFLEGHYIRRVIKCFRYLNRDESVGNRLIYSLKGDNRQDVLDVCADMLCDAIISSVDNPHECVFTNVPRRRSAIVEYGIDHSALLAKAVAERLNATYISILKSRAKQAQKSLERTERIKNADFVIKREVDLTGKRVVIIDDIITSGASVSVSASLLRTLGAKNITAACLAIAYRDS